MMSNPVNHFASSYPQPSPISPSQQRNGYPGHHAMPMAGLDALAEGSQYALEQLQHHQNPSHQFINLNRSPVQNRSHSFSIDNDTLHRQRSTSMTESRGIRKSSQAQVRKRISRACDQCNQLRTKCDGKSPCAHCVEFNLTCEYARERKKRGKASKKDLAAAQAAASVIKRPEDESMSPGARSSRSPSPDLHDFQGLEKSVSAPGDQQDQRPSASRSMSMNDTGPTAIHIQRHGPTINRSNSFGNVHEIPQFHNLDQRHAPENLQEPFDTPMTGIGMNGYGTMHGIDRTAMQGNGLGAMSLMPPETPSQGAVGMMDTPGFSHYNEPHYGLVNPQNQPGVVNGYRYNGQTESPPLPAFTGFSPQQPSPGWASLPSPASNGSNPTFTLPRPVVTGLKYPVLQNLLPHLTSIVPPGLACELLEVYFASSSSAQLRPSSPYVLGYILRKKSILSPTQPRKCSPALLASMLWIAAQTHEAPFLTSPPAARGRTCQRLLELTISLLRPLVHGPSGNETSPNYASNMVINGVALGGFGVTVDQVSAETSATGAIDDVVTYIHLATVVSASEYKAASLRWWNAAWSLARELKLGRELPPNPAPPTTIGEGRAADDGLETNPQHQSGQSERQNNQALDGPASSEIYTEEEREERRRIWWLLYTMDRHLALCYNRPLFLLDKECDGLLQPMSDRLFQSGDFNKSESMASRYRRRGAPFECSGHSIFGYFLPLMTILGEIVDLNHARNHPRFGLAFRNAPEWDAQAQEIGKQLEAYGQSLKDFERERTIRLTGGAGGTGAGGGNETEPSVGNNLSTSPLDQATPSATSSTSRMTMTESLYQTKIVVAYGTHIMHVLHILLTGKWDPISLLDDNDLWITSDSFITATSHAVNAAEAISEIIEYDPDLTFMPFFFGVYLLQGSFLLLLIADKLQGEVSPSVVKACETIVRAHEACVVTLNTEYQRNFRKVMRSALMQVKGRIPEDIGEQQQRRREVLALYRWTGDGTGLAL